MHHLILEAHPHYHNQALSDLKTALLHLNITGGYANFLHPLHDSCRGKAKVSTIITWFTLNKMGLCQGTMIENKDRCQSASIYRYLLLFFLEGEYLQVDIHISASTSHRTCIIFPFLWVDIWKGKRAGATRGWCKVLVFLQWYEDIRLFFPPYA